MEIISLSGIKKITWRGFQPFPNKKKKKKIVKHLNVISCPLRIKAEAVAPICPGATRSPTKTFQVLEETSSGNERTLCFAHLYSNSIILSASRRTINQDKQSTNSPPLKRLQLNFPTMVIQGWSDVSYPGRMFFCSWRKPEQYEKTQTLIMAASQGLPIT